MVSNEYLTIKGLTRWCSGKESTFPGWGGSPGACSKWQPIPVFLPGKSHGRGAWRIVVHGVAKGRTWLNMHLTIKPLPFTKQNNLIWPVFIKIKTCSNIRNERRLISKWQKISFCQMHRSWEKKEEKLLNIQLSDYE